MLTYKKFKNLTIVLMLVAVATLTVGCGEDEDNGKLDPNRTTESCRSKGTASVFGSAHTANCTIDGDGYFNMAFGHHHHK